MKNVGKRIFAILLSAIVLFSIFVLTACSDSSSNNTTPTSTPSDTPTPTDDPNQRLEIDLPDKNYGGLEFHVLEWSANGQNTSGSSWIPWDEIAVKDYEGDSIAMQVYSRNNTVQEKYSVNITQEYISVDQGLQQTFQLDATTSENRFQLITHRSNNVISLIQADLLADLNDYTEYLHFDSPWWSSDSVASLTLGDHLYVASGELTLRDKGATAMIFFNPTIAKNYAGLPDFYALVDQHQWTMEAMINAASLVSSSLDGDDLMNSTRDMWGMACGVDAIYMFYNGEGYKFGDINSEGLLEYEYGDEDSISAMKSVFDDVMYADWYCNLHTMTLEGEGDVFLDNYCLFRPAMVMNYKLFGSMEADYGILPMPLADSNQESYSSLVWKHYDCLIGIPSHTDDPEMSAIILEALSYESYYTVYQQFYNVILLDRAARDADSSRMLKIVFETRSYDPGQIWDFNSGLHGTNGILWSPRTKNSDMASIWEKYKDAVNEGVDRINEWIQFR